MLFKVLAVSIVIAPVVIHPAQAAVKANNFPAGLFQAIATLDSAANRQDLAGVMKFYSDDFKHSDGMTKPMFQEILQKFWQTHRGIQYRTEIINIESKGEQYQVETMTKVTGTVNDFKLIANLSSIQTYQNKNGSWQILAQEVLTERTSLRSGDKPPTVELRLPDVIGIGRQYALDAIVIEPVGNSLLLGAVVEKKVNPANYLKDVTIPLQTLRTGGIFRIGQAPYREGDRWISVVLLRENGLAINTQRLKVSKNFVGRQFTPLPESGSIRNRVPAQQNRQSNQQIDRQIDGQNVVFVTN